MVAHTRQLYELLVVGWLSVGRGQGSSYHTESYCNARLRQLAVASHEGGRGDRRARWSLKGPPQRSSWLVLPYTHKHQRSLRLMTNEASSNELYRSHCKRMTWDTYL
jgi:hypothetical protein